MMPGGHTVTFVPMSITSGRLGATTAAGSGVDVYGCFMQPVHVSEIVTDTDVGTELWRCIAPPVAAVLAAKTTGELIFNSRTYQITGAKPYSDFPGLVDHVTIDCEIQVG